MLIIFEREVGGDYLVQAQLVQFLFPRH